MQLSDRSYGVPVSEIPGPILGPEHLLAGDVLCFSGQARISNSIRFFDDCRFDHVAIVESVDVLNETVRVTLMDVGFRGPKRFVLEDYDDRPDIVLIRRHRIPGWQGPVIERGIDLISETAEYGWDRVLTSILISLTRFSSQLALNAERWTAAATPDEATQKEFDAVVGHDARRFVANLQNTATGSPSANTKPDGSTSTDKSPAAHSPSTDATSPAAAESSASEARSQPALHPLSHTPTHNSTNPTSGEEPDPTCSTAPD